MFQESPYTSPGWLLAIYILPISITRLPVLHILSYLSGFYTFFRWPFCPGGQWDFIVVQISFTGLLGWPKRAYAFFPEYIQEKTHTPFLAKCIIVDVLPLFLCFQGNSSLPLQSFSWNSAPLSSPLRRLTSIYFWRIAVIYNSAVLWSTVPLSSFLQLAFLWAGHKTAGLLQALICFRQGTLSLWLIPLPGGKWALHLPVHTPTDSLPLVLLIPVHLAQKLQTVPNRRLKALTLQMGRV